MRNLIVRQPDVISRFFGEPLFDDSLFASFNHYLNDFSRRFGLEEDKDGNLSLTLELPGYKQADVSVEYENGLLTVTAKNAARGETIKSLTLNDVIDTEKMEAKMEDGLLVLKLPRSEASKPRKIKVS